MSLVVKEDFDPAIQCRTETCPELVNTEGRFRFGFVLTPERLLNVIFIGLFIVCGEPTIRAAPPPLGGAASSGAGSAFSEKATI